MSEAKSPTQFSDWIASRSNMASDVNQAAITKVLEKIEVERAAMLEKQTMAVFQAVQEQMTNLRDVRRREKAILGDLAKVNAVGDKLLAGGYDDDDLLLFKKCPVAHFLSGRISSAEKKEAGDDGDAGRCGAAAVRGGGGEGGRGAGLG